MASLILGGIGSALGPISGFIGAALGALIDSLIINELSDPLQGPRLDPSRFGGFDEGRDAPWVRGTLRVPGQVIWMSDRRERRHTSGGGLKGPKSESYTYHRDIAVAWCRTECDASDPVLRVFANGETLFNSETSPSDSDDEFTVVASTIYDLIFCTETEIPFRTAQSTVPVEFHIEFTHNPVAGEGKGNFFAQFRSGEDIVVSGGQSENEGTFRVLGIDCNADGVLGRSRMLVRKCRRIAEEYSYSAGSCVYSGSCVAGVSDPSTGETITFTQTLPSFSTNYMTAITHYNGSSTQTADPTIEADLGTGNVPGYRGTCYTVFSNMDVTKWGATIPNFEAVVKESELPTMSSVVTDALKRNQAQGGIADADIDVTGVTGTVVGCMMLGTSAPIRLLEQLAFLYRLEVQDLGNQLRFFMRETASVRTIPATDIGARNPGGDAPQGIEIEQTGLVRLPSQITATFQHADDDYLPATRRFKRSGPIVETELTFDLLIAETPGVVAKAIREHMILMLNGRHQVEATLPVAHTDLVTGDKIIMPDPDGVEQDVRLKVVETGANHQVRIQGVIEDTHSIVQPVPLSEKKAICFVRNPISSPETNPIVEDLPPFDEDTAQRLGISTGAFLRGPELFQGGTMYESTDGGQNYTPITTPFPAVVVGTAQSVISDDVPHEFWDMKNSLTVQFHDDSVVFPTVTRSNANAGANVFLVGQEVILATTATKVGTARWTFTELRRGWRGTETKMGGHVIGEQVAALSLSRAGYRFYESGLASFNSIRYYKMVPPGGDLASAVELVRQIAGNSIKPFAPYALRHVKNATGDYTVKWRHRTRQPFRSFSGVTPSILETQGRFEIDIMAAVGSDTVQATRELTGTLTGLQTFSYTNAQQTTDFGGTPPTTFDIIVYPISDSIGRGRARRYTLS